MPITYLKGDATDPQGDSPRVIAHIVNTIGVWGAGFVMAVSKRWPEPEEHYRAWYRDRVPLQNPTKGKIVATSGDFDLGEVQLVQVSPEVYVLNMVAQEGIRRPSDGPPIRYDALEACLEKGAVYVDLLRASVHMPRIGTGLAGGSWERIEPLITKSLEDLAVYVYDWRPS